MQKRDHAIGKARPDALIRLKRGKLTIDYVAEIKRTLTPATLGAVMAQMRQYAEITERIPLLITDYVTPPITERLKAFGLHFVDAVGNAYLEGPDFLIWVVGSPPPSPASDLEQTAAPRSVVHNLHMYT